MNSKDTKYEKLLRIIDESSNPDVKKQIESLIAVCVEYWTVFCKYRNTIKEADYLDSQSGKYNVPGPLFRMFVRMYWEMLQYMYGKDVGDQDYFYYSRETQAARKEGIQKQLDRYCDLLGIDIGITDKSLFLSELSNNINYNAYFEEPLPVFIKYISNFKKIYPTIESFYSKIERESDVTPNEVVEKILRDEFVDQLWLMHLQKDAKSDIRLSFSIVPVRRALWDGTPSNMTKEDRNDHFLTANCQFSKKALEEKINIAQEIAEEYNEARDEDRKWRKMLRLPERLY